MEEMTADLAPQLRALVAVAAHDGQLTAAADALGVPQSSMSRRIHALEHRLAVPLFVQDGRGLRLTPVGESLASRLQSPLSTIERALAEVAGTGDPESGLVRFGFPLSMGAGPVPELLAAFHHRSPRVRLELKQAHGAELVRELRTGDLDLALMIPPPDGLNHRVVGEQELRLVVPERHWAATRERVNVAELSGETFIANPISYHLRQLTQQWCRAAGFEPHVAVEITEFATIVELVERGLGIAILPSQGHAPAGTVAVRLGPGEYGRPIALAWAPTSTSPVVERFGSYVVEQLPAVMG